MKKIYTNIIYAFAAIILITSCSDFLDEDSREQVEMEDQAIFSAEQFLTGVYGQFNSWDYAFSYLGITEILSDNADKGSASTDGGGDKDLLDNLTYTSSAGSFEAMWKNWYKTIGAATNTIRFIETNVNLTDTDLKNRYIGEAKFLRGLNYFFLVRGWGDVPIQEVDSVVRVPQKEVYQYIENDLVAASKLLPVASKYSAVNVGRAAKGSAQGLLSKVYLYQKEWQKAYNYADSVITSGEYALIDNYADIWKPDGTNSKESIFEIQAKGSGDGNPAQGIRQYSVTQGARGGSNGWGWGFNTPSESLLKAFNDAEDVIRRDATIIFRNGTLWDGREIGNTENPMYNYKAYTPNGAKEDWNDRTIKYMRYAEVLLIKAEAANELGKITEALEALNKVRERVNLTPSTTTDQAKLREEIWNERRLELAMEHDRWFDLVRTGKVAEAMRTAGKNFVVGKHELYPIPNRQIQQTPDMPQNPNW